jgi:hypothetical protein
MHFDIAVLYDGTFFSWLLDALGHMTLGQAASMKFASIFKPTGPAQRVDLLGFRVTRL